jgi:hypothetical protein
MKEICIERVSAADYWDGFKEESKEEFSDFLHCGFSVLYSDEEKEKFKTFKPVFNEEAQLYLLAKIDNLIVARSFSEQTSRDTLFMCMSYVKKDYRNNGIYTKLLKETISVAKSIDYTKVTSCHNSSNNKIIIPKLKQGFVMSGMRVNAGYGTLVELSCFLNKTESDMQDFRCGYRKPTDEVKNILSI